MTATSSTAQDLVTVDSEDDTLGEGTHVSVHLSLSGDLNPVRLEQASVQTEYQDYSVAGTSAATERYLYIGPEGRNISTQAGPVTATVATQTELVIPESATVIVVPGGTNIQLG